MQASLKDLAQHPESLSFHTCQRVLHECHEIIFGDLPPPSSAPYSSIRVPFYSRFSRKKVKPHMQPAVVGIGMLLAGVPGLPQLTSIMGQVAIEQGRIDETSAGFRSLESGEPTTVPAVTSDSQPQEDEDEDEEEDEQNELDAASTPPLTNSSIDRIALDTLDRGKAVGPAQTSPTLHLHLTRKPRLSYDPFGQDDPHQPVPAATPFQSTPSISSHQHRTTNLSQADVLLQQYDVQSQMHLLRSHYCQSEVN